MYEIGLFNIFFVDERFDFVVLFYELLCFVIFVCISNGCLKMIEKELKLF